MTGPRRRGGRSGVSGRVAGDIVGRLRDIRALWAAVQNDPKLAVADAAAEFYYAIGAILEGRNLRSLDLRKIDRVRVEQLAEE